MEEVKKIGAVEPFDVVFYFDRDGELNKLPQEDIGKFEEKVVNAFPERKDGRYGCVVKVQTDGTEHYLDIEDRAIARAKHLIGLEKQRVKLLERGS